MQYPQIATKAATNSIAENIYPTAANWVAKPKIAKVRKITAHIP
jgi:hypothetical protein